MYGKQKCDTLSSPCSFCWSGWAVSVAAWLCGTVSLLQHLLPPANPVPLTHAGQLRIIEVPTSEQWRLRCSMTYHESDAGAGRWSRAQLPHILAQLLKCPVSPPSELSYDPVVGWRPSPAVLLKADEQQGLPAGSQMHGHGATCVLCGWSKQYTSDQFLLPLCCAWFVLVQDGKPRLHWGGIRRLSADAVTLAPSIPLLPAQQPSHYGMSAAAELPLWLPSTRTGLPDNLLANSYLEPVAARMHDQGVNDNAWVNFSNLQWSEVRRVLSCRGCFSPSSACCMGLLWEMQALVRGSRHWPSALRAGRWCYHACDNSTGPCRQDRCMYVLMMSHALAWLLPVLCSQVVSHLQLGDGDLDMLTGVVYKGSQTAAGKRKERDGVSVQDKTQH